MLRRRGLAIAPLPKMPRTVRGGCPDGDLGCYVRNLAAGSGQLERVSGERRHAGGGNAWWFAYNRRRTDLAGCLRACYRPRRGAMVGSRHLSPVDKISPQQAAIGLAGTGQTTGADPADIPCSPFRRFPAIVATWLVLLDCRRFSGRSDNADFDSLGRGQLARLFLHR